jgi:hypothetical protein
MRIALPMVVALALAGAAPAARAAEPAAPPPADEEFMRQLQAAEQAMRQGMTKLLDSFDLLLQSLPRYEAPTVDENGDIIIRRKRPERSPTLRTSAPGGMI